MKLVITKNHDKIVDNTINFNTLNDNQTGIGLIYQLEAQ